MKFYGVSELSISLLSSFWASIYDSVALKGFDFVLFLRRKESTELGPLVALIVFDGFFFSLVSPSIINETLRLSFSSTKFCYYYLKEAELWDEWSSACGFSEISS